MGYERTVMKAATATAVAAALAAAGARLLGPATVALVADGLPRAREAATSWMTPPYLYLVINVIIISIAASSRFQPGGSDHSTASTGLEPEQGVADVETAAALLQVAESAVAPGPVVPVQAVGYVVAEEPVVKRNKKLVAAEEPVVKRNNLTEPSPVPALEKEEEEEEEFAIPMSRWTPRRTGAEPVVVDKYVDDEVAPFADMTNSREKPLVSARFSRKATKPSPEGSKALRVARPRKEETLESTWKAITEGRARPLARHLKKSDTWDTRPGRYPSGGGGSGEVDPAPAAAAMRKAETFGEGRSKAPSPAPVRREPSPGQDELNRRVEAFINKFNMEMRLQRQESLKHYNEMLRLSGSGGSHY